MSNGDGFKGQEVRSLFALLGKYIGGKVLTAILIVGSLCTLYWFYQHPEQLASIWLVIRRALLWLGLVLILPWALFFVTVWAVRKESNVVAGGLLGFLLALDVVTALYLADWNVQGSLAWSVLFLGFLAAGVYNFLVCNYQAERLEESV